MTTQTKTQPTFKNGQEILVRNYGKGTIIGRVGYYLPLDIRIEFESGDVRDFNEKKLTNLVID